MSAYKKKGFSIGIGIFLIMMFSPAPSGLSEVGWDVAAVAVLMAIWWATETVPVAITSVNDAYGLFLARQMAVAMLAALPVVAFFLIFQKRVTQAIMLTSGIKG